MTDYPTLEFLFSFAIMWAAAWFGAFVLRKRQPLEPTAHDEFRVILAATLTLLALIIGFTFSMAVIRYDQRKNLEEAEANTISAEYVRTDLLPAADGAKLRGLLKDYLNERITFYLTGGYGVLPTISARTKELQAALWAAATAHEKIEQTRFGPLVIGGMSEVLNAQSRAQAALWDRIPTTAWGLMMLIAVCCNLLVGYGSRNIKAGSILLLVLPLMVSISFFLIADIDSPRRGLIRVGPQNLLNLERSLPTQ